MLFKKDVFLLKDNIEMHIHKCLYSMHNKHWLLLFTK